MSDVTKTGIDLANIYTNELVLTAQADHLCISRNDTHWFSLFCQVRRWNIVDGGQSHNRPRVAGLWSKGGKFLS